MKDRQHDVVVVGGGLAGRAAAVAAAVAGLDVLHLSPQGPPDRRTSALMGPSVAFLQSLGVVDDPSIFGHPLRQIRIIDATNRLLRAPETVFDSSEAGLPAFGWNFANAKLGEAFDRLAGKLPNLRSEAQGAAVVVFGDDGALLTLSDGTDVSAALVVGADGKASLVRAAAGIPVREHAFGQAALVADLRLGRPLETTSVEFHYPNGPFTLVPAGEDRANLVWIDNRAALEAAKADTATLPRRLADKSQRLFGAIELSSPTFIFSLSTLTVSEAGRGNAILVGEAAHAFPPIGAQGLNLGFRDVADMARLLTDADRGPGWARRLSVRYAERRTGDLARTGVAVDTLFRSLLAEMLPAQMARAGGLWALKLLPPLRRQAFAAGMGSRS